MKLPIGIDNFEEIIKEDYFYVDKTLIIKDILDSGAKVLLFPRPRRFGKTLTMSMIDNFFNVKRQNKELFNNLNVSKTDYLKESSKYPVIFISLKDIKSNNWEDTYEALQNKIAKLYIDNEEVIEILNEEEKKYFIDIKSKKATSIDYQTSLLNLTIFLTKYYNEKTIVLIDEYDSIIQTSYVNKYYEECINFMRNFLSSVLKTNEYLKFSVLTGILRVSKESIFSGLNNIEVHSIRNEEYNEYFGFTSVEIDKILNDFNLENKKEIKEWYNGYNFGGKQIYNPWSILNLLESKKIMPYWINTSSNEMLSNLFKNANGKSFEELKKLIDGESVEVVINENVVYNELTSNLETILNFMYMTGYLTIDKVLETGRKFVATLKIPNIEVSIAFDQLISGWFSKDDDLTTLIEIKDSILNNKIENFEYYLNRIMINSMSYFDSKEAFYHGLMLGLLLNFGNNYIIESNRESGLGRYDLKIMKKDKTFGAVFEFKITEDEKELENSAKKAKEQVENRIYYNDLKELNVLKIQSYGIAFNKKKAIVK